MLVLAACLNLYTIVKFPEYSSLTLANDANVSVEDAAGALGSGVMNSALGYAKANPDAAAAALQNTAKWAAENPETVTLDLYKHRSDHSVFPHTFVFSYAMHSF